MSEHPPTIGPPAIPFDRVLGSLLIGTWGDSILLAVECFMVHRYLHKFPRDRWSLKALVLTVLMIDIASSVGNYAYVYLYTITNWGNPAYLTTQHWPVILFLPTTGMSACIVQMFLISRMWKLSRKWYVVLPLACASLASCAGAWGTAIITTVHPLFKDRGLVQIPCTIWLICSAVCDCGIALSLLWELARAQSSFRQTQGVVTRLMGSAIQTGSVPALLAVATLVAFLADKESNICVGLGFCLGRVYSLTLIKNLMLRRSHSRSASRANSHSISAGSSFVTKQGHGLDPLASKVSDGAYGRKTPISHTDAHLGSHADRHQEESRIHFKAADVDFEMATVPGGR